MQRAIAAEAALAAAVVAGEVNLTGADLDGEEPQDSAAAAEAAEQAAEAGPSRGVVRTRRSAPPQTDDDEPEVTP